MLHRKKAILADAVAQFQFPLSHFKLRRVIEVSAAKDVLAWRLQGSQSIVEHDFKRPSLRQVGKLYSL